MARQQGEFVWYELMTDDVEGAKAFYGAVVGWQMEAAPGDAGSHYTVLSMNGKGIGGILETPPMAAANGAPSRWYGYVGVDDVDAAVGRLIASGGTVHHGPEDLPGIGRFASVSDPQGAGFVLFADATDMRSDAFHMGWSGHVGWNELHSRDWEAALSFYQEQFGWRRMEAMDMGPMGTYLIWAFAEGDPVGGMFNSPNMPRPMWLHYFCVDEIDAAAARVTANGGAILMGPAEVPGGAWIIQATDPQGVMFALVGMRAAGNS